MLGRVHVWGLGFRFEVYEFRVLGGGSCIISPHGAFLTRIPTHKPILSCGHHGQGRPINLDTVAADEGGSDLTIFVTVRDPILQYPKPSFLGNCIGMVASGSARFPTENSSPSLLQSLLPREELAYVFLHWKQNHKR